MERNDTDLVRNKLVSKAIGPIVRELRLARNWTQAALAAKLYINRVTIIRIEAERHSPTRSLAEALESVFGLEAGCLISRQKKVNGPSALALGFEARQLRRRRGLTLDELATAAGVSGATLSRFERRIGGTRLLLSSQGRTDPVLGNDAYAVALGFETSATLQSYLDHQAKAKRRQAREKVKLRKTPKPLP